jgi:hypothetical protein
MSRINAQQSGNWSDPKTWAGLTLPQINDEVFCNGFNINIDVDDITVKSISNRQTYYDTFGGNLILINYYTCIQADLQSAYGTLITANNNKLLIKGNIKGSDYGADSPCIINSGTIELLGNLRGGSSGYSSGILNRSTGIIQITGSVFNGTGGWSYGINNDEGGEIIINNQEISADQTLIGDYYDKQNNLQIII